MLGSDWIALGGLVVAALALVLTFLDHRAQRSIAYKSALYERQLQALEGILSRLRSAMTALSKASVEAGDGAGQPKGRRFIGESTSKEWEALRALERSHYLVLSARVINAVGDAIGAYRKATDPLWPGRVPKGFNASLNPSDAVLPFVNEAVRRMRDALGSDELTFEIGKVTGESRKASEERFWEEIAAADEAIFGGQADGKST